MTVEIFMDCGAPSIYNELSRLDKGKTKGTTSVHIKHWGSDDFSYVETPGYKAYRRKYLEFVLEHQGDLSIYPNLDVIHNAELTYKNQKWFEKRGAHPAPVWHLGSNLSWLRKYLNEGHKYICLGGLVPNTYATLRPALDRVWLEELTTPDGMPKVKVHGFGMTSFDLMYRYPWFSVDSKSWVDYARFGSILIPQIDKSWRKPMKVTVTRRGLVHAKPEFHLRTMPDAWRKHVLDHIKAIGVPLGVSKFKKVKPGYKIKKQVELWFKKPVNDNEAGEIEIIEEPGVINSFFCRMDSNIRAMKEIEKTIEPWPWSFKPIGRGNEGRLL